MVNKVWVSTHNLTTWLQHVKTLTHTVPPVNGIAQTIGQAIWTWSFIPSPQQFGCPTVGAVRTNSVADKYQQHDMPGIRKKGSNRTHYLPCCPAQQPTLPATT
jgi:hypothetical protein